MGDPPEECDLEFIPTWGQIPWDGSGAFNARPYLYGGCCGYASWSKVSGPGSVDANGIYTQGENGGTALIRASCDEHDESDEFSLKVIRVTVNNPGINYLAVDGTKDDLGATASPEATPMEKMSARRSTSEAFSICSGAM